MKRILSAVGLIGIIFTSCDSGSSSEASVIDSTVVPASAKLPATTIDTTTSAVINPQQSGIPVTLNGTASNTVLPAGVVPTNAPQVTATSATTAPGMNAPHGQPGHRCDINVGAPLNSKPNPTATAPTVTQQPIQASITQPNQTTTTSPVQTSVTATPTTTPTAPGMNPPHGQPNHRCDIAVGAPLNSKPAATPSITQTPVQTSPNVTPAGTTTFTPPGMNPPHGQPNHRCDIAVGAPLNSAPAVKKDSVGHK